MLARLQIISTPSGIMLFLSLLAASGGVAYVVLSASDRPAHAQNAQDIHPGLQPYTPTAIEWLTMLANVHLKQQYSAESKFQIEFLHRKPDTIIVYTRYDSTVNRKNMNEIAQPARRRLRELADAKGYKWLRIEEEVELIGSRTDK